MNHISLHAKLARIGRLGGSPPAWKQHPAHAGVALCLLVGKDDSAGALSTLLVRLDRGAAIVSHRHEAEVEQHIVLEGNGVLTLDGEPFDYRPGQVAVIPRGHEHAVVAGANGMVMLAVFSPAP